MKLSGTITAMACGNERPLITKNSNTLSKLAESLMLGCTTGEISRMSPKVSLDNTDSRALNQRRLPLMVFISPLWARRRNGWAKLHVGKVLVEKRECTSANPEVK